MMHLGHVSAQVEDSGIVDLTEITREALHARAVMHIDVSPQLRGGGKRLIIYASTQLKTNTYLVRIWVVSTAIMIIFSNELIYSL